VPSVESVVDLLVVGVVSGSAVHKRPYISELPVLYNQSSILIRSSNLHKVRTWNLKIPRCVDDVSSAESVVDMPVVCAASGTAYKRTTINQGRLL